MFCVKKLHFGNISFCVFVVLKVFFTFTSTPRAAHPYGLENIGGRKGLTDMDVSCGEYTFCGNATVSRSGSNQPSDELLYLYEVAITVYIGSDYYLTKTIFPIFRHFS